jgi:predicted Zn-ribbon and HTH transcriptional regulator
MAKVETAEMMDDDDDDDAVYSPPSKPADIPRDVMLLRMDHESIRAAAQLKPRNNAVILKELLSIIDAYPAAADEAIYSKPVGTVWAIKCGKCGNRFEASDKDSECPKCGSEGHDKDEARRVKKYAENLSIRAAETIRSIYGANSLRVAQENLADGTVRITGIFVDYATATMTSDERIVSPWYKKRGGGMERTAEDRFLNLVVKAEKAKLRRDIILDAVPAILKAAYRDACEKKIVATVTAGYVEENILPFLPSIGLNVADAETIVGKPRSMGWTNEDIATLRKVCSALKNGEMTKEELFAELKDIRDQPPVDTGGRGEVIDVPVDGKANVADMVKPQGKTTSRPGTAEGKPKTEKPPKAKKPEPKEAAPVEPEKPKPPQPPAPEKIQGGQMFEDDEAVEEEPPKDPDEADEDLIRAYVSRIKKAETAADIGRAAEEVARLRLSVNQRRYLEERLDVQRKSI